MNGNIRNREASFASLFLCRDRISCCTYDQLTATGNVARTVDGISRAGTNAGNITFCPGESTALRLGIGNPSGNFFGGQQGDHFFFKAKLSKCYWFLFHRV